jgi:hypothetical protein
MKIKFGYHKKGNCWQFKFSFMKYWRGKVWWFSFWRFFVTLDFRKDFISEMLKKEASNV